MAECMNPFLVKRKNEEAVPVPCGKCPSCVKRKISGWSFRLMQQDKVSRTAHFITLTYNNENLPFSPNGYPTLVKRDLQLFLKRLRKLDRASIKYYAVGEYGSKGGRPHYHLIIFNTTPSAIRAAWRVEGREIGYVHDGDVRGASVGYTLKYVAKRGRVPAHDRDDREPEFGLMSKRLGASYITPAMTAWHNASPADRLCCILPDGRKIAMPRYYKERIFDEYTRLTAGDAARKKMLEKHKPKTEQELWDADQNNRAAYKKMLEDSKKGDIL